MSQTAISYFVYAGISAWSQDEIQYTLSRLDPEYYPEAFLAGQGTIQVDTPKLAQILPGAVAELRKKQASLRAEAEVEANKIEERIQKLLSLTFSPGEASKANEWEGL